MPETRSVIIIVFASLPFTFVTLIFFFIYSQVFNLRLGGRRVGFNFPW